MKRKKVTAVVCAIMLTAISILTTTNVWADDNSPQYYGICTNGRAFTEDCSTIQVGVTDSFDYTMYEVVDADVPMRMEPNNNGRWHNNLQIGDVLRNGKMITNDAGKKWLKYTDENGKKYYVYSGHLKKHDHNWETICRGDIGHTDLCKGCSVCQLVTDIDPYVHCNDNVLCQVFFGDWSSETSLKGIVLGTGVKLIGGPVTSLRDYSANITHSGYEMAYGSFVEGVYASFNSIVELTPCSINTPAKMSSSLNLLSQYLNDLGYVALSESTKEVLHKLEKDTDIPYGAYCGK